MRIASWNVNSLRAREDVVLDWLEEHDPDVLCMQETKLTDQEFPEDPFGDLNYDVVYRGQPAYNGVAIAAHEELKDVEYGLQSDPPNAEPRLIAATVAGVRIIDIYLPNGQAFGSEKYRYKLDWMARLVDHVANRCDPDSPVVICGDYNLAPAAADVWWDEANTGVDRLFVSQAERSQFVRLLELGFVDAYRHFYPDLRAYTWWDYRNASWETNHGLRIDHVLVTRSVIDRAKDVKIHTMMRGEPSPSDHVPIVLELSD